MDLFDPKEPVQELAAVEAKTVLPKPYMSWSRLSMYLRCGEQFRRVYVMRHRAAPGIALIAGSATHAGVEKNMLNKLKFGKLLSLDEVVEITRAKAAQIITADGISLMGEELTEIGANDAKVREHVQSRSEIFARLHHGSVAPYINPLLVEHTFRLVTNNFPFDLVGVIDLQEQPTEKIPVGALRDTKTSGKFDSSMADKSDQLTLYGLWGRQSCGAIPPLMLDVLVATKEPKAYALTTTRTDHDIDVLSRRIESVARGLEKGVFLPAPTESWCCDERYCGFAKDCPYYRKRIVALFPKKLDKPDKAVEKPKIVLPDKGKVVLPEKKAKVPEPKKPVKGKRKGAKK